jgi:hypothetical protein
MDGRSECEDEVVVRNIWEDGCVQVDVFVDLTK